MKTGHAAVTAALVLAAVATLGAAPAKKTKPVSMSKEQKIRSLLNRTGAAAMGQQMLDTMMAQVEQNPDTPPGFVDKFKMLAAHDDLVERIIPIYDQHLDDADVDGILAFYESKAGQDLAKAQPLILQESMEAGQKWAAGLAEKALAELKKEEGAKPAPSPSK